MDASDITVVGFAKKTGTPGCALPSIVALLAGAIGFGLGSSSVSWTIALFVVGIGLLVMVRDHEIQKLSADERGFSVDGILETRRIDLDDAFVVEEGLSSEESRPDQPFSYSLHVTSWRGSFAYSFVDVKDANRIADSLRAVVGPIERARIGAGWAAAEVRVSSDEVAYKRFGRVRTLSVADIARWGVTRSATRRSIVLRVKDGRRISFHEQVGLGDRRRDRTPIDRISRALEGAGIRSAREPSETHDLYRRRARTVTEWLDELGEVARSMARGGSFREAVTPRDSLWRIVEDADAPDDARIGAAVALRIAGDDAVRARIAETAAQTASIEVRAALESLGKDQNDFVSVLSRVRDD